MLFQNYLDSSVGPPTRDPLCGSVNCVTSLKHKHQLVSQTVCVSKDTRNFKYPAVIQSPGARPSQYQEPAHFLFSHCFQQRKGTDFAPIIIPNNILKNIPQSFNYSFLYSQHNDNKKRGLRISIALLIERFSKGQPTVSVMKPHHRVLKYSAHRHV